MKPGSPVTSEKIQNGTNRIRKFLIKKGHLSGRAGARRGAYDSAKNTIDLTLDVSEGARVDVEVTGAKFSHGDLKKMVPIYQEGSVDSDLLEEGKRNIRERLEREGYFDSSVEFKTAMRDVQSKKWSGQEQVITYTIERGDRHKLIGIEITGNHYFDKETLATVLVANPSLVEKLDAVIRERRRHTARELVQGREGQAAEEPESLRGKIARFFGLKGL